MLPPDPFFAQLLQTCFVDDVNVLRRYLLCLLHPKRASGRYEGGIGVRGDLYVVLKTPVWGAREALSGSPIPRVPAPLASDERAKEVDWDHLGGAQPCGEICSRREYLLNTKATENKEMGFV